MSAPEVAAGGWVARLRDERPGLPDWWWAGKVAEEAGEAWREYIALAGLARQGGGVADLAAELADVVIAAYACAQVHGIDLDVEVAVKGAELLTRDLGELGRG